MDTLAKTFYTASATSTGDGRSGHVRSSDGVLDLDLLPPAEHSTHTNPEQLFAAGYAACFHSALKGNAKRLGLDVADSAVTADVSLGQIEQNRFGLAVTLHIELGGLSQEDAEKLAEAAHQGCPYSNATRGNIEVTLDVQVG